MKKGSSLVWIKRQCLVSWRGGVVFGGRGGVSGWGGGGGVG
jgi:hypothetical protein